ncbi:MAG: MFS transporter [Acidothermales bacterium]|nr:MFS transporter [Acidothermales bacterium]
MTRAETATVAPRSSRIPHRGPLGLLVGTHVFVDFHQGAVPAMLPFLVAERHYTYTAATGITLAATLLSSLVQPGFGVLTDRHQIRWLVGAGLIVAAAGIGLSGVGTSYALTWVAIALSGVGVAAYHPEATRAARGMAGNSVKGMSMFSVGGTVGVAVAPLVVTPVLAAWGVGATPLLAIPAVCAFLVLYPLWVRARRRVQIAQASARRRTPAAAPRPDDWRRFGWLTGAVIARSVCYFGLASFVALYLIHHLGGSAAVGGAALTVFVGAGAAGNMLGGVLADRIGRVRTVRLGYVIMLPGLAGFLLAPNVAVAFVAVVVLGAASFLPFAVHVNLGQDYLPNRIGTASGVTLGLAMSVGGLAAPVFGTLADAAGLVAAVAALAVFPLVSLACSLGLREPAPH